MKQDHKLPQKIIKIYIEQEIKMNFNEPKRSHEQLARIDCVPFAGIVFSGIISSSSSSGTKMRTFSSGTTFFATSGTLKILF